ncbi:hypothetical protein D3C71_923580 [compost metagenome]
MPEINTLYSWADMGKNGVDIYIADSVPQGELRALGADQLREILDMRNADRRWAYEKNSEKLIDSDKVEDGKKYYIYYNYHSSSGYKTEITVDENRTFKVFVHKPIGLTLCSFWSEVIIFEIV